MGSTGRAKLEAVLLEQRIHELELCRPTSRNLSLGLAVRPKPSSIDVAMPNSVNLMLGIGVLVLGNEVPNFLDGFIQGCFFDWEQVCVRQIVDEVQVLVSSGALLLVQELGSILYHLKRIEIFFNFWVEQANLALFELKLPIHVDLSTPDISLEVAKHFLAGHLEEIADPDFFGILGDKDARLFKIILTLSILDMIHLSYILCDGRQVLACLRVIQTRLTAPIPDEMDFAIWVGINPLSRNSQLYSEHMSAVRRPELVSYLRRLWEMPWGLFQVRLDIVAPGVSFNFEIEALGVFLEAERLFIQVSLDVGQLVVAGLSEEIGTHAGKRMVEIFVKG